MKLLAVVIALATGAVALKTEQGHQLREQDPSHELFGRVTECCAANGGDICGNVFRSCCQKGRCTSWGTCPDYFEYKC